MEALPDAARVAKANRSFLAAAVRYVAGQGVGQYVDIGAGLPTSPNVHETARVAVPGARGAYVDNDPLVVAHARALLATDRLVTVVNGDARKCEAILSAPELGAVIDPAKPVCVLFVSMLHFMTAQEADAAVAALRQWMAPGSYMVISVGHENDSSNSWQKQVQAAYGRGTVLSGRSATEIAAFSVISTWCRRASCRSPNGRRTRLTSRGGPRCGRCRRHPGGPGCWLASASSAINAPVGAL